MTRWLSAGPLPLPGRGNTLERWRRLAHCGAEDLAAVKIYESHEDARAILHELGGRSMRDGELWAVYAADPPQMPLRASMAGDRLQLDGRKPWCSAARDVDFALVTCVDEADERRLAIVPLKHRGVRIGTSGWAAAGMRDARTVDIELDAVPADFVGGARAYLDRPGFWHGAIGVAACWHGAAARIAADLRARSSKFPNAHLLAHLGAVRASLFASAAALRQAASTIDTSPDADVEALALTVRAITVNAVEETIRRSRHALGAGPMCTDAEYATRLQDLEVFILQSHAERDLESLGRRVAADAGGDESMLA